jgi:hypothetical protein
MLKRHARDPVADVSDVRELADLNGLGGYKLLDALDAKAVESLIDDLLATRLRLTAI